MKLSPLNLVLAAAALAAVLRFVPVPIENFSALSGLAILSGTVIQPIWLAFLIPVGCRFLTDLIIHSSTGSGFYDSLAFDYAAYVLIAGIGVFIRPRQIPAAAGASILATLLFFSISNLGVWCMPHAGQYLYPRTLAGLQSCFVNAIPFARGTFFSDALFTLTFVGILQLISAPARQTVSGEAG